MKRFLLAVALSLSLASAASAQVENPAQYPILSLQRLHAGVRTEYAWWTGKDDTQLPGVEKEFALGLVGAYSMVPRLSATGRILYHLDSRITAYTVGVNFEFYSGGR